MDVIRLLLSYGASPTSINVYGKVCLHFLSSFSFILTLTSLVVHSYLYKSLQTPSELADPGSEARSILEAAANSATNQRVLG